MPSVLTDTQKGEIAKSMQRSDEMAWCSGIVKSKTSSLPLFYKTSRQRKADGAREDSVKCVIPHLTFFN